MPAEKIHIEQFVELAKHHPVIDVRSPGEYNHAHIPGAHSLPLFTDEERKVVGTTYKQQSREAAIKIGLDYFGPKMRPMVEEAERLIGNKQSAMGKSAASGEALPIAHCILVYCWRGGMRSGAVSWLLNIYGFKVYTLVGGYKKFRNYVLDTFSLPFDLNVLGGYTGSGKTETLKTLKEKGEPVIDLEAIANHKGSAFGSIGMPKQPTQEMFENLLAMELRKSIGNPSTVAQEQWAMEKPSDSPFTIHPSPVWLEDESQRIGLVNIPKELWNKMRRSILYFLDIPFEERLNHITGEYGCLEKQKLIEAIERIREKLGGLNAKMAIQLLEEGNTLESFRILLNYYDKFYLKALHNREGLNSLLQRVECTSVIPENASHLISRSKQQSEKV
ncbi:MAG TPA: tRNA 2-selenouridine(34) synthase MnmH [Chitinophagaceae bacterium]|nr:tRNA 2-selenouridine(34) synthase MnmH [Chitinophagaceae bacterium]